MAYDKSEVMKDFMKKTVVPVAVVLAAVFVFDAAAYSLRTERPIIS